MNSAQAKDAIHRARTRLLASNPFDGYISCRLKLREVADLPASFATDGEHLFYNPAQMDGLSKTKLVGRIVHETNHVWMDHPARMAEATKCLDKHTATGVEDHTCYLQCAQVAADYAIQPRLKDAGFDVSDGIFPEVEYWKDSMEEHFKRIKKSAKTMKVCGSGCGGTRPPTGKDGKRLTPAEMSRREAERKTTIINAYNFAKQAGNVPADVERMMQDIRAPKIAWFDVLRRFMQATTKNDYRMLPPNRRYIHQGLYLPSLRSESVSDVLLIIDGSGSTMGVFPQFINEFASILLDVRPETLHVMVWDTRCAWYRVYDTFSDESKSSLSAQVVGMRAGGGSNFIDCFTHFEQLAGIRPAVAIVLTDMEIYFPPDPEYPVLWVATEDIVGPFGDTVRINI